MAGKDHAHAGPADEHDAEAGREDVAGIGAAIDRLVAMQEVEHDQDCEVEDARAQDVADGDVGNVGDGDGAQAGDQLGQRGDGRQQDETDPAVRQAGLLGDDVAGARQLGPREADEGRTHEEL